VIVRLGSAYASLLVRRRVMRLSAQCDSEDCNPHATRCMEGRRKHRRSDRECKDQRW